MVRKLVKAPAMFRAAVQCWNLSPSTHSPATGDTPRTSTKRKKVPKRERRAHVKHIPQTSSYQPWLDFFLLLSSLCPSWLPTEVFPGAVFLCFTSSVVEAATTQSCLKTPGKKDREKWKRAVLLTEGKMPAQNCNSCPVYKANLAYLLSLCKKPHPPLIAPHRLITPAVSHACWTGCVSVHSSLQKPWSRSVN